MRTRLARFAIFLMLVVTACQPVSTGSPAPPGPSGPTEVRDEKQVLRIAARGLIGNMTPQASRTNLYMYFPLYDSLTVFGKNYEVKPWVAEKWDLSADGLNWTFTIRKDMKWPNGDPLTAEDVAFSLNEVFDKKWTQTAFFGTLTGVRATSDSTVVITTRQQDGSVPNGGPYLWILPKKYYESVGGFDGFLAKPVGSGPYELVEFRNTESIHFKRRTAAHAFRKPQADEVIIRAIPEPSQIINGLQTGDLDIAALVTWSGDQTEQLKRNGMTVEWQLSNVNTLVMPQGSFESRSTPLKDIRVRHAMNYAINKDAIVNGIFRGYAEVASQLGPPGSYYFEPDVKPYPYDPKKAKELLAEAGYPNGFKLPGGLDYSTARGPLDVIVAVQSDLRSIGIEFDVTPNEESVFVDKAYGRRDLPKGDLWAGGNGDDNGYFTGVRTFYGCGKPTGGRPQALLYCDPEWDRLLDAAYGERDPQKRTQLFRQASKLFREAVPAVYLFVAPAIQVWSPKVKGVEIAMPLAFNFDSAYKVK